jgi:hypothetical protein
LLLRLRISIVYRYPKKSYFCCKAPKYENFVIFSVADPDPVGSGPFWSDPDVWDRIILALINDHISTFLVPVCLKAKDTSGISVV